MINDTMKRVALSGATAKTKEYIQSVLSLKESGLGLPKELTGGSRTSDISQAHYSRHCPEELRLIQICHQSSQKFQGNLDDEQRVPAVLHGRHYATPFYLGRELLTPLHIELSRIGK